MKTKILMVSCGLMLMGMGSIQADGCPAIGVKDVRTLCRWKGFAILPGVHAGEQSFGNVTLKNIGECGQEKSLSEFFNKNPQTTVYKGQSARDIKDQHKIYCIYKIDMQNLKFEATGVTIPPPKAEKENTEVPTPSTAPKGPKIGQGVDLTRGPNPVDFEIKKRMTTMVPPPRPARALPQDSGKTPPPVPSTQGRPALSSSPSTSDGTAG